MTVAFASPITLSLPLSATAKSLRPRQTMTLPPPSVGSVPSRAAAHLLSLAKSSIAARGRFTVALSGGSLPSTLASGLSDSDLAGASLSSWTVILADERLVAHDDADSNFAAIRSVLPALADAVMPVDEAFADEGTTVADAARSYAKIVDDAGGIDAVFLGMGPDGHTASLFPGHALLDGDRDVGEEGYASVRGIEDSPKPPPRRITLTLGCINAAGATAFVCTGGSKAPVVKRVFEEEGCDLPAAHVKGAQWFLDEDAAAELSERSAS